MNFGNSFLIFQPLKKTNGKMALQFIKLLFLFYFLDPKKSPRNPRTGTPGRVSGISSNAAKNSENKFTEFLQSRNSTANAEENRIAKKALKRHYCEIPVKMLRFSLICRSPSSPVAGTTSDLGSLICHFPVSLLALPTVFDSGEPFSLSQMERTMIEKTPRNSLCQFCRDSNQNWALTR